MSLTDEVLQGFFPFQQYYCCRTHVQNREDLQIDCCFPLISVHCAGETGAGTQSPVEEESHNRGLHT